MNPSQVVKTRDACRVLANLGMPRSPSYLQKARARGPDDPRDKGPDFYRDQHGVCWYELRALDRYAVAQFAARKFRATEPQPANFRANRGGPAA